MSTPFNLVLRHAARAFMLWGSGWKHRRIKGHTQQYTEWRDPISGLWHREDAALRIVYVETRQSR
ncbi:MAG: hypothetical protein M3436_04395 [Pseudomonadota bacterium]|nr:hypothetical protein [Pseudomonadota bacterium]